MKRVLFALFGLLLSVPAFAAILPAGYTQVEYIESTGTQYIDTGIKPTNNTKIDITYSSNSFNHFLFGSRKNISGDDQQRFIIYLALGSGETKARLNPQYANTNYPNIGNATVGTKYNVVMDSNGVLQDGVSVQSFSSATFTGEYNLVLFGNNTAGTVTGGENTIYAVKLYDNNTLVRNFVPAQTVINGETVNGMYDTVNNRFYKDDAGGNFIAGPEACPNGGVRRDYVSASGTGAQVGTPTPEHPVEPTFYHQGRMILRAVGDYKDSYDASTGKITRNVGVKVLDGTEDWTLNTGSQNGIKYFASIDILSSALMRGGNASEAVFMYSSIVPFKSGIWYNNNTNNGVCVSNGKNLLFSTATQFSTVALWKQYLVDQYNAGTPVTIWYPLAEPVEEDWTPTSWCDNGIKVATKDYVTGNHGFGPIATTLNAVITAINGIVSSTVTQATSISTLATQKQTRPDPATTDGACPAGVKCLLVEGTDGKPHWYQIQESFLPIGYTPLQYIESTGTQYIDTGVSGNAHFIITAQATSASARVLFSSTPSASSGTWIGSYSDNDYWSVGNRIYTTITKTTKVLIDAEMNSNGVFAKFNNETANNATSVNQGNWYLFSADNGLYPFIGKVWGVQITQGGTLVRDFVPAIRNSDGVVGLYDLAATGQQQKFYTNSATTGDDFTAGPEL